MSDLVIYPIDGGGIAIVTPTGVLPIAEVARKDVPAGVPYLLVADTDLPTDGSSPDLWTADFSAPDGHGIGAEAWFAEQAAKREPAS